VDNAEESQPDSEINASGMTSHHVDWQNETGGHQGAKQRKRIIGILPWAEFARNLSCEKASMASDQGAIRGRSRWDGSAVNLRRASRMWTEKQHCMSSRTPNGVKSLGRETLLVGGSSDWPIENLTRQNISYFILLILRDKVFPQRWIHLRSERIEIILKIDETELSFWKPPSDEARTLDNRGW
jgi:hypothetical protein